MRKPEDTMDLIGSYAYFGYDYDHPCSHMIRSNILSMPDLRKKLASIIKYEDMLTAITYDEEDYYFSIDEPYDSTKVPLILAYLIFCDMNDELVPYKVSFRMSSDPEMEIIISHAPHETKDNLSCLLVLAKFSGHLMPDKKYGLSYIVEG